MVTIYLSGGITKVPDYEKRFQDVANSLRRNGIDNGKLYISKRSIKVLNPVKLPHDHNHTWVSYMRECCEVLCSCDKIYMLKGWWKSKGARIEWLIAKLLGIEAYYQ